jgi:hypothetical protein
MTNHRKLADVVAYLCAKYPHKSELSNARLTKLVYLADWKSVQDSGRQITDIDWVFNNYGPWVPDVVEAAEADRRFETHRDVNAYGSPRLTVTVDSDVAANADSLVDGRTANVLDLVMAETQGMYFNPFIRYVYSTLPVRVTPKGYPLPLASLREQHPEAAVALPSSVVSGALNADEYVVLRAQLSQITAERLLDAGWQSREDPTILTGRLLIPGLSFQRVVLRPDFLVSRRDDQLHLVASGTADGSADLASPSEVPSGYRVDADDAGPWATHLTARFELNVEAVAATPVDARVRTLRLTRMELR